MQASACAVLLENGHLLRTGALEAPPEGFGGTGAGGRIQEFDWDGNLVWDFKYVAENRLPHHDFAPLPNGNVLLVVWDRKTADEAYAIGRSAKTLGSGRLLPDCVVEIKPTGPTSGEVVWEWRVWDHLIQDLEPAKRFFGDVASHSELIDLNYDDGFLAPMMASSDGLAKLRSIGYVSTPSSNARGRMYPDWTHMNSVAYNPALDQIVVSIHGFSEIWVIDHSTTKDEAASHAGGRSGKGGDLLYRWGNPRAYQSAARSEQKLFAQHAGGWIGKGLPGEGDFLVFNNGERRPGGNYSSVEQFSPPIDGSGSYFRRARLPFLPLKPKWTYAGVPEDRFYSALLSNAQRLANGNTLVCSGVQGVVFEVTADGTIVWKYKAREADAFAAGEGKKPKFGRIMTPLIQDMIGLSDQQKSKLDDLDLRVSESLEKLTSLERKAEIGEFLTRNAESESEILVRFGEALPTAVVQKYPLSAEAERALESLEKQTELDLNQILEAAQRGKLEQLRSGFGNKKAGSPGGNVLGAGGCPLFRALRYSLDYPAFKGRNLAQPKNSEER